MKDILNDFKKFKTDLSSLKAYYGDDLYNVSNTRANLVCANDLIFAIRQYTDNLVTKTDLLDWVNTVWFTDLYQYIDTEANSIASVMTLLETLDEDDVSFSERDFKKMIVALERNMECIL